MAERWKDGREKWQWDGGGTDGLRRGRRQKEREMTCQLPSHSGILLRSSIHRNAPALSPAHTHAAVTTWGGGGAEVGSSDWLRLSGTAKVSQWETPVSFAAQWSQRHAKEWGLEKSRFFLSTKLQKIHTCCFLYPQTSKHRTKWRLCSRLLRSHSRLMCCQRDCEQKLSINRSGSALILLVFNRLAWLQKINVTIQQEGSKKKRAQERRERSRDVCRGALLWRHSEKRRLSVANTI